MPKLQMPNGKRSSSNDMNDKKELEISCNSRAPSEAIPGQLSGILRSPRDLKRRCLLCQPILGCGIKASNRSQIALGDKVSLPEVLYDAENIAVACCVLSQLNIAKSGIESVAPFSDTSFCGSESVLRHTKVSRNTGRRNTFRKQSLGYSCLRVRCSCATKLS